MTRDRKDFPPRHQAAFDRGVRAWFDDEPRTGPYQDVSYTRAWRSGWDYADRQQQLLNELAKEAILCGEYPA